VVAVDQAFTSGLLITVLCAVCRLHQESRRIRQSKHLNGRKNGPKFPSIRIKTRAAETSAKLTLGRQIEMRPIKRSLT
jgi:hypothetical protein